MSLVTICLCGAALRHLSQELPPSGSVQVQGRVVQHGVALRSATAPTGRKRSADDGSDGKRSVGLGQPGPHESLQTPMIPFPMPGVPQVDVFHVRRDNNNRHGEWLMQEELLREPEGQRLLDIYQVIGTRLLLTSRSGSIPLLLVSTEMQTSDASPCPPQASLQPSPGTSKNQFFEPTQHLEPDCHPSLSHPQPVDAKPGGRPVPRAGVSSGGISSAASRATAAASSIAAGQAGVSCVGPAARRVATASAAAAAAAAAGPVVGKKPPHNLEDDGNMEVRGGGLEAAR